MTLHVFTAFSGYDSQCMALDRLHRHNPDFNYELVGWAEIDKHAIAAHNAVYPQWADRNYGDISKIDWSQVPDFDLFTYSSPCQDFSQAGKQAGGTEGSGTRSSLLWECRRAILAKKPKYLLMENVAALVSQKFIRLFNAWQLELERYGYRNFAKVLNAKDYGVPQNRERIFMVSVLDEQARYEFPDPMPLQLRLKDVLEPKVDERYYLKDKDYTMLRSPLPSDSGLIFEGYINAEQRKNGVKDGSEELSRAHKQPNRIYSAEGVHPAISAQETEGRYYVTEPIVLGWVRDEKGNVVKRPPVEVANTVTSGKRDNTQNYVVEPIIYDDYNSRIREDQDTIGTITTNCGNDAPRNGFKILEPINTDDEGNAATITAGYYKYGKATLLGGNYGTSGTAVKDGAFRIRKLTERECFRLMDVPEEYIDRIQAAGISRSQQYKMAGNSIVVACMYHLFRKLWIDTQIKTLTLF